MHFSVLFQVISLFSPPWPFQWNVGKCRVGLGSLRDTNGQNLLDTALHCKASASGCATRYPSRTDEKTFGSTIQAWPGRRAVDSLVTTDEDEVLGCMYSNKFPSRTDRTSHYSHK